MSFIALDFFPYCVFNLEGPLSMVLLSKCSELQDYVISNMSTLLHHNDVISHRVHRHEPPVTAQPLSLLHVDEELVVVDKPASIPVSGGGGEIEGWREGEGDGRREGGRWKEGVMEGER